MSKGPSLRHMEVFHWVMACGTQAQAAKIMATSQPALSRDLAQLERLLGHRLFDRVGRRLVPTAEAVLIHRQLSANYMCVDQLVELSRHILDGTGGVLRVGAVPSLALMHVPDAIRRTASAAPQARFELFVLSRDEIYHLVERGQLDIAFTVLGSAPAQCQVEHLTDAQAVCVFHRSSPLSRLAVVTPKDLEGLPFISLGRGYVSRQNVDAILLKAGVTPNVVLTTQNAASACGMIRSGYGVTVIDPFTAAACACADLQSRPFKPAARFTFVSAVPLRQTNAALASVLRGHLLSSFTAQLEKPRRRKPASP